MSDHSTPGADVHRDLTDALEAVAEDRRLNARITRAEKALAEASAAARQARTDLSRETDDVRALESFSPARIWATLRGERATRLSTEQAEHQAAEYAAARAEAAVSFAREELDAARAALGALGDVEARLAAALDATEQRLRDAGGPLAEELTANGAELGTVRSERTEVGEADDAATAALEQLEQASQMLRRAKDWSTYDTFFGGGMLSSAMKYERVEDAEELLRAADRALKRLSVELADVGLADTPRLAVEGMTRTFDVWFDNIFTDWSIRDRINRMHDDTLDVMRLVVRIRLGLRARYEELVDREDAATARREELLLPR
ncbi:hypothetical protein [Nocardioides lianchengensis]|uniref:hypothetical protein n=1 Tax=Nocardioides lianchengensis TaxID=1045774 RepID=UPI000B859710|nr:hypothetical protein [Nocardioides lianchengensis]NYG10330.1 hypothetical protein [Nocardioides lianchengensis]